MRLKQALLTHRTISYKERARFYGAEYATDADREFLQGLVSPSIRSVLEIPAGAGRNLPWLGKSACNITFVDREVSMLRQLLAAKQAMGLGSNIQAVASDMCYLNLKARFELIIVPQGGFQLLPTKHAALKALRCLRKLLSEDGTLVIDISVFRANHENNDGSRATYYDPRINDGVLIPEWTRELPKGAMLSRSRIQRRLRRSQITDFFYAYDDGAGHIEKLHFRLKTKKYWYKSLASMCERAGLEIDRVYKDYSGKLLAPTDTTESDRLIFLLKRSQVNRSNQDE